MEETVLIQILTLKDRPLSELQAKYQELFPDKLALSDNKGYLWRKIAYRLQELEYGIIPQETQVSIQEMIQKYDPVNNTSIRPQNGTKTSPDKKKNRDRRLPIPGTVITKEYKGIKLQVKILESGFEYNNKVYKSLTAIAKEVTGAHWNGYLFFNL